MFKKSLILLIFCTIFATNCAENDLAEALALVKARKYSGKSIKAFIGFVDLIEGAECLISEEGSDPINSLERLMDGVTSLIGASVNDLATNTSEHLDVFKMVEEFRMQIDELIISSQINKSTPNIESENKKLIEGLAMILYNSVYILIDPKSMRSCLLNILSGTYKVVSAILAEGKVNNSNWTLLLRALASIFNLSQARVLPAKNLL